MATEKKATEEKKSEAKQPEAKQPEEQKYIVNVGWIDVAKVISAAKGKTLKKSQVAALKAMVADKKTKKSMFEVFLENKRIIPKPAPEK